MLGLGTVVRVGEEGRAGGGRGRERGGTGLGLGAKYGVRPGLEYGVRGGGGRRVTSIDRVGVRCRNGVDILVDEEPRGQVVKVKRVNDRLITIKLVIEGFTINVCSVYAPQVGLDGEEKKRFWKVLDEVVRGVPSFEKIVVAGDFNGLIGVLSEGYGDVHGGYGFGERNEEGVALLDFMRAFGMVVVNSSFPKKEDHLVTF
ncbi:craniofacial development protein 2-like [Capsicum annuum]|uniref:craniofacial development protein 2-like n=1 Tax=Capsicum annuum TaxID=4072 RepID=UPI001FB122C2|nr:craniofacial development protein 2-like [Capsicum annuum]